MTYMQFNVKAKLMYKRVKNIKISDQDKTCGKWVE